MFTRKDFDQLAQHEGSTCVTIYIPTHRAGQETQNGHDAIVLKDALKDAKAGLEVIDELDAAAITKMLAPAKALVDNALFWRQQSDALAIFLADGQMHTFHLPIPMESPMVYVDDQFHLAFAARMLAPGARWYVFSVTQSTNRFFECTRNSVTPIRISDVVPENMEEVLKIYEGTESLQHHGAPTTVPGGGGSVYTGQGSNEDRQDEWLGIYFRRIGNGITDLIAGQEEPLVIAADGQHINGIKDNIDYPHIVPDGLTTHPSVMDPVALQRESWELVQPIFDKTADQLQDKFASANGGGTLANGFADVAVAARNGQVAALYVAEQAETRIGKIDDDSNSVTFTENEGRDLLEYSIRQTIAHGGQVLYRLAEAVPDATDGVTAVLRYEV